MAKNQNTPEIFDGIDISDMPEHVKEAFRRKFDKKQGKFNRNNLKLSDSDKNMWICDWHNFPSGHLNDAGEISESKWRFHLEKCKNQYKSRLPLHRDKKRVEGNRLEKLLIYSGIEFSKDDNFVEEF